MSTELSLLTDLANALRAARKARGLSIAALAELGNVSPRLVSEFENGRRSHVSLATALRLLQLVGVPIMIAGSATIASEDEARDERAKRRRSAWVGEKTTLTTQSAPQAPPSHAARLIAVAQASRLAVNLQHAHRKQSTPEAVGPPATKRSALTRRSE